MTVSSMRLISSGRMCVFKQRFTWVSISMSSAPSSVIWRISCDPMLLVITMMTFEKVHGAPLSIGESSIIEHLQQDVRDVGMRLLHLVEEHHAVGTSPDRFGQPAALFVAHVSGRGSDQSRDRVLFHVFGHVDPDHRVFGIEEVLGEGLAESRSCRLRWGRGRGMTRSVVGFTKTGTVSPDGFADRDHRFVLADDAPGQTLFHVEKLFAFAFDQFRDRNAGPLADHLGDLLRVDLLLHERVARRVSLHQVRLPPAAAPRRARPRSPYWMREAVSKSPRRFACSSSVCLGVDLFLDPC